jgi:DNA-directed RNA polymerase subunit H (RpoH/RPB5)
MPPKVIVPPPADRHWKAFQTLLHMFHDRGYTVSEYNHRLKEEHFAPARLNTNAIVLEGEMLEPVSPPADKSDQADKNALTSTAKEAPLAAAAGAAVTPDVVTQKILALFDVESAGRTGVKTLREVAAHMEQFHVQDAIIVSERGPNTMMAKEVNMLHMRGFTIQFFCFTELYRNVTQHMLVPRHVKLSEQEKQDVCKKNKAELTHFPHLNRLDPVVRYYGFKKGTMVAIHRHLGGRMQPYTVYKVVH